VGHTAAVTREHLTPPQTAPPSGRLSVVVLLTTAGAAPIVGAGGHPALRVGGPY
jgi:hypothetical protein